MELAEGI